MKNLLFTLVILLLAVTTLQLWSTQERTTQKKEMELTAGQGEAQIGGPFTLIDQHGKTVTEGDFLGKVMLVFFGFTHCPDICPVTVATLSKTMALLGEKADLVVPVFITVDPQRDTPDVMRDYLANFDQRMVGLTGTPEQIKQVETAYKAYAARSSGENTASDAGKDYTMDHSGYIYIMGKDGKYFRIYPYNTSEQEIAKAVENYLSQ
jgi:cytochrome oxidase Cu insertion factor (SCO1/SenC/PrrC family)